MGSPDLLAAALMIAAAEEAARQVSEGLRREPARRRTRLAEHRSLALDGWSEILRVDGEGRLVEFIAVSRSPDFTVKMQWDDEPALTCTYGELKAVSQASRSITAVEEDGRFIVNISDISWSRSFSLFLESPGGVVLDRVVCIYETSVAE